MNNTKVIKTTYADYQRDLALAWVGTDPEPKTTGLKWYTYHQNNSGGVLSGPSGVYVLAHSGKEADELAQLHAGVYFDGVDNGFDCDCCGDRWGSQDWLSNYDLGSREFPTPYDWYGEDAELVFIVAGA